MLRPHAATRSIPSSRIPTAWRRAACAALTVSIGWIGACTLSTDEFEPSLVDAQGPGAGGGGSAPGAGAAGSGAGGSSAGTAGAAPDDACDDGACAGASPVGGEVDAGPACELGRCSDDADCATRVCRDGCCAEPTCSDGVTNGSEVDVDCGGGCPARCEVGERCRNEDDCAPGLGCPASLARCTPAACDNGVRDGDEVSIDCGGGECAGCPDGAACSSAVDCESGSCSGGRCTASCSDGVRNQDERGVDCGGVCGGSCPAGSACSSGTECTTGVCAPGNCALASDSSCCQIASCSDGVLNGDELALDCGSSDPSCPRCGPGIRCTSDADCASGACEAGRCCGGTTSDCTRCAERLSPTVNCDNGPNGSAANCAAFLACLSSNASVCSTRFATGCTNDPGGVCNHNTYGGNDGLGVQQAARVLTEAGCTQ